jgi:hypothetical protein
MKNLEYKKDYERRESLIWQKITIRMWFAFILVC